MDFFTAPPPRVQEQEKERENPPWTGPPNDILGGVVPIERMLFRSETLAIVLANAVAFPVGVTIRLQMAARRVEGVNEDTWWDRHDLMFGHHRHRFRAEDSLPDEVVRFGVRFPDGSKATTVDGRADSGEWPPPRPEGPILKRSRGGSASGDDRSVSSSWSLWLWPLPPPEPFEFAVEWPLYDVPLTFTELDGAAIVAAAERAQPYWP